MLIARGTGAHAACTDRLTSHNLTEVLRAPPAAAPPPRSAPPRPRTPTYRPRWEAPAMQDAYAPPLGGMQCPYCGLTVLGAPQPSAAVTLITFTACCPACGGGWNELRKLNRSWRYWRDRGALAPAPA